MARRASWLCLGAVLCGALLPACQLLPRNWGRPTPKDETPEVAKDRKETGPDSQVPSASNDIKSDERVAVTTDSDATPYHLIRHPFGQPNVRRPVIKPLWTPDLDWPDPTHDKTPEILPSLPLPSPFDLKPLPEVVHHVLPAPEKQEPLVEALSCFLKNESSAALRHLQSYDEDTRELFQRVLPPLSQLTKKKLNEMSPDEVAALQIQIQELLLALRSRTNLRIEQMCFCESVSGFGDYKPLARDHSFQAPAGKKLGELVQVYVELRNVASERRELYYESRLSSLLEIRTAQGQLMVTRNFGDRSRPLRSIALRTDFHNNYRFYVPQLPPGRYELTIQVTDETSRPHRVARKSLDFVVATPSD